MNITPYTLITGASSGIGKELAIIAGRERRNIVLIARSKAPLEKLAKELTHRYGILAEVIVSDLAEQSSPQLILSALHQKNILVDTLVNNAGVGDYGPFGESDRAAQLRLVDLNVRALTELTHLLLPGMVKRQSGRIMNVGSVASFFPGPMMSSYFASKAYVLSFSEALAEELRGTGVTVTCLCPGSTKTEFGDAAGVGEHHSTRTSRVTATTVAAFGWAAMVRGKPVAIHGYGNRAMIVCAKFLPRVLVARLVKRFQ